MENNWIDKWLTPISQSKLQDLYQLFSVLKDCKEELGKDTFEIPYREFHSSGIKSNIQNWLKNLNSKGILTIWKWENKSKGSTMRFSVAAPYDDWEDNTNSIYPGGKIELHPEKFEAVYLWLETHLVHIKQSTKSNSELKKTISQVIKIVKGKKEKKLLQVLSDLKPHKTPTLLAGGSTQALSHRKIVLNTKLERGRTGFHIETLRGDFSDPKGFYQLKYLNNSKENN